MSLEFYIDDAGPVPALVTDIDGATPITPLSATADIVNLHTGEVVIDGGACEVGLGYASYIIPDGSPITSESARYVAYIQVVIDATTKTTVAVPFDVLDKNSYFIVDRWRRKVEFAKPNDAAISEQEGRDWVDQAVAYLNMRYATGYTSVLASLTPDDGITPADPVTIELIASVASLMARTAWFAGKGNWRDEEMSLDVGPFAAEWARLEETISKSANAGWFSLGLVDQRDMYNRDKINSEGWINAPDDYFEAKWANDPEPGTSWYETD